MPQRIKVSDYIACALAARGIHDVFMVTGGSAMHLNESFGSHPDITYYCTHHEQAAAMAAESYARLTNTIAPCVVTSGPGGTNALTGLVGAWLDSTPALFISGQVRQDTSIGRTRTRQIGLQEAPIVSIVKPITKYAAVVSDPAKVRYHLEKGLFLATSGRPGPVWLDVPLDVQASYVDPSRLRPFDPRTVVVDTDGIEEVRDKVRQTVALLKKAERPVIVAGNGIRLAGAASAFLALAEQLNIPVVTAINAHDLIPSDHPLFCGRPGITGDRVGNFVVQNADVLISIGSRLSLWVISYAYQWFAREATHVMVDIDRAELQKKTVRPAIPICADARLFIEEMQRQIREETLGPYGDWHAYCKRLEDTYPRVLPEQRQQEHFVNSYHFIDVLSDLMDDDQVIVVGEGTAFTCTFQCIRLKRGQRLWNNVGCAPMGYDLPAAIGACIGNKKKPVVCIAGDGGIQMNIQELQTIVHHQLPVKIFVLNNRGYLAIRITQDSYFNGHYVGSSPESAVSCPDMVAIARAYGIPALRVDNHADLAGAVAQVLAHPGPMVCELVMDPNQPLIPKTSSYIRPDGRVIARPMEDMYPFLERSEFLANMFVEPVAED